MSNSKGKPGSKQTICKPCHDRKVKCSKTQPCTNCVRRNEECIWLGEQPPAPAPVATEDGLPPSFQVERLRIESADADQRFRTAVGALARYILPVKYMWPMIASSLNDVHVTGGWVPLDAAQQSYREYITRNEARAYRKNDAQTTALLLSIIGERLAFCPNAVTTMLKLRQEQVIVLPPTLTGLYTQSAPAHDLAPFELARCYAAQAELAMQLAYDQEDPVPVGWHALLNLHKLESNAYSSRHLGSALAQLMVRNLHRPHQFQTDTTVPWRENRQRIFWGLYWEDRLHAAVLRRPRNCMVVDDLPPPLNMGQEAVSALTDPVTDPPSYSEVNDGSALMWRAMLARCLDGVVDDQQHLKTPKDIIPLDRAIHHSNVLANLRDRMPSKLRVGDTFVPVALKVQRIQLAAVCAGVQLKLLMVHIVDGMRMDHPETQAESLAFPAAAELIQAHYELHHGGSPVAATSSPALAYLYSPILLFEATALLVLATYLRHPHDFVQVARLGLSFLQPMASRQEIVANCIGIMEEMLVTRGVDTSEVFTPPPALVLPEIYNCCRPVLDKKIVALLFDASSVNSIHHQQIIQRYNPYMGSTRGAPLYGRDSGSLGGQNGRLGDARERAANGDVPLAPMATVTPQSPVANGHTTEQSPLSFESFTQFEVPAVIEGDSSMEVDSLDWLLPASNGQNSEGQFTFNMPWNESGYA